MCLNAMTRLQEDPLPGYHYIKIHSDFEEYFVPDHSHPSNYWNIKTYTSLGHSLMVELTNNTCAKSSIENQAYKVVMKYQDGNFYPGLSICALLILEG